MRTKQEMEAEIDILSDKIWYNRHQGLKQRVLNGEEISPKIWEDALKNAKNIEKKYGEENLWNMTDFEWGMLNGKLSALRWLIGEEWDFLDT